MCPVCKEPLVVFELESVEIDRCARCHGTWLDAGELEQLLLLAGVAPAGFTAAVRAAGTGTRGRRRCPRCRRGMNKLPIRNATRPDAASDPAHAPAQVRESRPPATPTVPPPAAPGVPPPVSLIEIDHCPAGHGLWLDPGELRNLVCCFAEGEAGAVARFLRDLLGHDLAQSGPRPAESARRC